MGDDLKEELVLDIHEVNIEELCKRFDTNLQTGLSYINARSNQEKYGINTLTPPDEPTTPEWVKLCGCLLSGPSLPIWLGSVPCFVAYAKGFGINNLYLGATLSSIVTVTGIYTYYKQAKTIKINESFKNLVAWYVTCLRDGEKCTIRKEELTLGDIVYVTRGENVPADIRIVESMGLKVDNSSLTGESEPQSRSAEYTHPNPLETKNLAFCGTRVEAGSGVGMVVNIGDNTIMGRIAGLSSPLEDLGSSTIQRIDRYFFRLSGVTVVIGGGLCVAAYFKNLNWLYPVVVGVALIPTAMYASINAGIEKAFARTARKNVLVKGLEAFETMGTITTICTSMTSTLTQGRMTVAHAWLDNKIQDCPILFDDEEEKCASSWKMLERAAVLCNNAEFKPGQAGMQIERKECLGNITDAAILKLTAVTTHDSVMEYREFYPKVCEIQENSFSKFQVSIHKIQDALGNLLVMKGAPESIMSRCSTILVDGAEAPLDGKMKSAFNDAVTQLGGLGEKVIGFCDLMLPQNEYPIGYPFDADEENWPMEGLRFLGLMSIIDPPRAAVPDAISKLRSSGIKIIMITGEHPVTAEAIARSVGIISEGNMTVENIAAARGVSVEEVNPRDAKVAVIHGGQLRDMSMFQLEEVLTHHSEIVFARLSPTLKLWIVETCQDLGNVVAVTGSDLNDTPALKRADLGIAMGIAGAQAAKNAADMILMDDNFASVVSGVEIAKDFKIFPY